MGMTKTKRELALFRKSAAISNSCIPIIERSMREDGITEREIARRVRRNIYARGGKLSFRTLVACGDRSAVIHPKPAASDRKISGIGFVDFGASYRGYKTDVTVPFVKGKISARERRVVKAVIAAYNIALKSWKIGEPCWKLHEKANGYLKSKGLTMGHALGHGLGRKIHESPIIAAPDRKALEKVQRLAARGDKKAAKRIRRWEKRKKVSFMPGMVFTIEPGAYVKELGGCRIENSFEVSGKKLKSLTKAKLIEVR